MREYILNTDHKKEGASFLGPFYYNFYVIFIYGARLFLFGVVF